jgi:hypothetical protein
VKGGEERDAAAEPGSAEGSQAAAQEEELYRRLDEQLGKLRVEDVLVQSVVSLLNLSGRRIAKEDERDLDQARLGIEAVRALLDHLPEDAAGQVRDALAQVQMLYARHAREAPASTAAGQEEADQPEQRPSEKAAEAKKPPPGIWVPPGSVS